MKIKSAPKPLPVKATPKHYGLPISALPPCAIPPVAVSPGRFKLPEGKAFDRNGGVLDRMARIREYLLTMPKTSHPSRSRLEEIVASWGHNPDRVQEIFKGLDLSQAPETEEGDLP